MPENEVETVKLFVAAGCPVCDKVKELADAGRFSVPKVDLIDVTTEDGFPSIEKYSLDRVPRAIKGDKACQLWVDPEADVLMIDCDSEPE